MPMEALPLYEDAAKADCTYIFFIAQAFPRIYQFAAIRILNVTFVNEWQHTPKCLLEPWACVPCPLSKIHILGKSVALGVSINLQFNLRGQP